MPQKYEQFTPQLLPRYWRSPKMRFMNVNGDAYLCFLDFHCQTVMKPLKQEAMVLVWLCLFITHTHTHKAQKYKVYPHLLDREQTPPLHDTTATQIHMQRTRRKKKSDIVVLVFFLEHHEFCFWPRGLSRGLSLRRSGFVIPAASVWFGEAATGSGSGAKNTEKLSFMLCILCLRLLGYQVRST